MKKSSEGFQFWGWTKFLQNSNSGDEKFSIIPILWMKKSSEGFQFWGWTKVSSEFQFW
jgi:hypothetical protein